MGTPFITPSADSRRELPQYGFSNNNRVSVMHLGLSGQAYDWLRFQLKASYSQNLGTYEVPFARSVQQFSSVLNLSAPLSRQRGLTASAAFAIDLGDLYARNTGVYVGIRKEGQSRKRE